MLSTATPSLKLTVFADSAITETEALDKAVALYEHLTDKEVEIPQGLDETGLDTNLIKQLLKIGYPIGIAMFLEFLGFNLITILVVERLEFLLQRRILALQLPPVHM